MQQGRRQPSVLETAAFRKSSPPIHGLKDETASDLLSRTHEPRTGSAALLLSWDTSRTAEPRHPEAGAGPGRACPSWGVGPFHPQVGPLCVQAPQAACAVSAWSLGWGARGPQGRQLSKYRTWDRAATENKTLREHSAAGSSSRSHPKGSPIPINRNVAW